MFEMKVTDAISIAGKILSVAGPCNDRCKFTSPLVDEFGNQYDAHIPFMNYKEIDKADEEIVLGIRGNYDAKEFIGRVLTSV